MICGEYAWATLAAVSVVSAANRVAAIDNGKMKTRPTNVRMCPLLKKMGLNTGSSAEIAN